MTTPDKSAPAQVRKAYHSPHVRCYGAIKAVTQAAGMMGMNADGGTMAMTKTR